jgi:hypothetical protein
VREAEGQALHYLFVADAEMGDLAGAEAWAKEVYRVYGPRHVLLPRIAHDLALIWSMQGFCKRAQAVFNALLPHFERPTDRLSVLSNIVRAAGALGDRATFEQAWGAAWELSRDPAVVDGCAGSLLAMARGAKLIGERALAVEAAQLCIQTASGREEDKIRLEAEALLDLLRSSREETSSFVAVEAPSRDEAGDALAVELIEGLSADAHA